MEDEVGKRNFALGIRFSWSTFRWKMLPEYGVRLSQFTVPSSTLYLPFSLAFGLDEENERAFS